MENKNYLKVLSKKARVPLDSGSHIGSYEREKVHKYGWWHSSVLVNLVRINTEGNLQILVQKRSNSVDIAKERSDQSVASQIRCSDQTVKETFLRGIKEELDINKTDIEHTQFLPKSSFFIAKKYRYSDDIINKEKIYLFVAKLKKDIDIKSDCKRVDSTQWVDWDQFTKAVIKYPEKHTKTVRFFIKNTKLKKLLETFMVDFVRSGVSSFNSEKLKVLYFSPKDNKDVIKNLT